MNNFYTLLLICSLLVVSTSCGQKDKDKQASNVSQSENEFEQLEDSDEATLLFEKLMDSFSVDWRDDEPSPEVYPDYFGGVFIGNDNMLVVAIVGEEGKYRKDISKILESDNFRTESCTYSYREMMEVMNEIDIFLTNPGITEEHPIIKNFGGAMADVFENRVIVNLMEVNDEIIQAFQRDISNSRAVTFREGSMFD